jgi:hypothetical protein
MNEQPAPDVFRLVIRERADQMPTFKVWQIHRRVHGRPHSSLRQALDQENGTHLITKPIGGTIENRCVPWYVGFTEKELLPSSQL